MIWVRTRYRWMSILRGCQTCHLCIISYHHSLRYRTTVRYHFSGCGSPVASALTPEACHAPGKCFIRFLSAELTESAYRELHGTHIERELVSQLMIGTQRHSCNRVLSNDKFLIWITQVEAIGMSYWVFTTLLYLQTTSRWPPGVGHQCIVCNPIWNVQSVFVRIMDSILFAALRLQILLQVRCIFFRRSN